MMANALLIADYVITKTNQLHQPISHFKLNKILYLLNYQSQLLNHEPLFDDAFRPGMYGPVVQSVFDEYNNQEVITTVKPHLASYGFTNGLFHYEMAEPFTPDLIDLSIRQFIDSQLPKWLNYNQNQLINLTTQLANQH